jgi:hypothetical protein
VLVPEVSDEMTAWLRVQVEADKTAAELAIWSTDPDAAAATWTAGSRAGQWGPDWYVIDGHDEGVVPSVRPQAADDKAVAAHIAIHDPRDVIADCDAKLRLLDLHEPIEGVGGGIECEACGPNNGSPPGTIAVIRDDDGFWPCATVLVLASGYRHRDGWQESWSA